MGRKTNLISLCLLGAVAMVGSCACCGGWWDEWQGVHGGPRGHGGGSRFLFFGSSPHGPTSSGTGPSAAGTSRGGFGATGSAAHGGGA